jgi:hypothetical protein
MEAVCISMLRTRMGSEGMFWAYRGKDRLIRIQRKRRQTSFMTELLQGDSYE